MTHVITQPCIGTKSADCVEVCPVDCIYEASDQFYIHPGECIDCGACVSVCPVSAIFPEAEVPSDQQEFIARNAELARSGGKQTVTPEEKKKQVEEPQEQHEVARQVFAEARKPAPPKQAPEAPRKEEAPKAAASPTPGRGGTTTQKTPPLEGPGQAPGAKAAPQAQGQGAPPKPSKEELAS